MDTIPLFLIDPHTGYDAHKNLISFMECVSEISITNMDLHYVGNHPLYPDKETMKWGISVLFGRLVIKDVCIYLFAKSGNQRLDTVLLTFGREYKRSMASFLILPSGKYLLQIPDPPPTASKSKWNPPEREPDRKWEVCREIKELINIVPDARYVVGYSPSEYLTSDADVRTMFDLSPNTPVSSYTFTEQDVKATIREVLKIADSTPVIQRAIDYLAP